MELATIAAPATEVTRNRSSEPIVLDTLNLTIGYRNGRKSTVVADNISVKLYCGELICLLGPNGAGKSTLMRTVAGMQSALAGEVRLQGQDVSTLEAQERARQLSVVLTERASVGNLSARELVALGRHPHTDWVGRLTERDVAVIDWALEAVGATVLAERSVLELSDGERQKVMIARALAQEPMLMLLDEPTAYLDLPRRVDIMSTQRTLAHAAGRSVLLSTHDLDLALRSADRIWLLSSNGVLHDGTPEDLVLNGSFAAAFEAHGATFDPTTGSFQLQRAWRGEVALQAEGLAAEWTRRALQRRGFQVTNAAPLRVVVEECDEAPVWQVRTETSATELRSIADLLAFIDKYLG